MTDSTLPKHVAIIMDGNGRWAKQRLMPRIMGHRAGVKSVRRAIDFAFRQGISVLSLFTMSVENFLFRPESEVSFLFSLLSEMLAENLEELHQRGVVIRVIGDISVFPVSVQTQLSDAIKKTASNTGMTLVLALNYSGRWDILQAAQQCMATLPSDEILTDKTFERFLSLADLPQPDLLIRTSGEQRISNFFLWQIAYAELFFTKVFWPEFDENIFSEALAVFSKRERRFGLTGEQLKQA